MITELSEVLWTMVLKFGFVFGAESPAFGIIILIAVFFVWAGTVFDGAAVCIVIMVYLSRNDCRYTAGYGRIVSFLARPSSALVRDILKCHSL